MLPETSTLALFVVAAVILLVTPGPAVLYIVARSIEQGRLAGLVSSAGLSCGGLVHVLLAALGLSAILISSPAAFHVIRLAGAAYLIYLGVRTLIALRRSVEQASGGHPRRLFRVFRDGVLVNLLNPKAALFFFAFLPQFVDPSRGSVSGQVLVLGLAFTGLGMLTDSSYALLAGTAGNWLRRDRGAQRVQRLVAGTVYVGLGLWTAFGLSC